MPLAEGAGVAAHLAARRAGDQTCAVALTSGILEKCNTNHAIGVV